MGQVPWADVKAAARAAFGLWNDERELAWAEHAWGHLAAAGLTSFESDVERHRVMVRLLVLPSFYRDWTARVDQEPRENVYSYWAETLELRAFSLGQLLGPEIEVEAETEFGQIGAALDHLVPAQQEEVARALIHGFGCEEELFLSLWRIRHRAPDPHNPEDSFYFEDDDEVLTNLTAHKMVGYDWITEGCPSSHWQREHCDDD